MTRPGPEVLDDTGREVFRQRLLGAGPTILCLIELDRPATGTAERDLRQYWRAVGLIEPIEPLEVAIRVATASHSGHFEPRTAFVAATPAWAWVVVVLHAQSIVFLRSMCSCA